MGAALLAGSGTALVDHYRPARLEEFQVFPGVASAPPVPAAAVTELPTAPVAGPVQLNSATAAQLLQLPGIGPKTAARILSYRQEHGSFKTIADLVQVPGIGPRTLERLRTLVVVE